MLFRPSKMSRIRLIVHKRYFDEVISALQDLGVVQIEALPESALAMMVGSENLEYKRIGDYAQRFRGLESLLIPHPTGKRYIFESIDQLTTEADEIKIDERVSNIRKELDSIEANQKDVNVRLALLQKIKDFSHDLSILNTKNVVSFVVQGQQLRAFDEELSKAVKSTIRVPLQVATIFSIRKSDEKDFSTVAEKHKVSIEFIPAMSGTVAAEMKTLENQSKEMAKRKASLDVELNSISEKYYQIVSAIREQFDIEMEKFEISNKLGVTNSVVALEGWVPAKESRRLERIVKQITNDRYILEHIRTHELPPTKMENPIPVRLYEAFIRFYSLPKSNEIDPTIIFALAFPIFFGFMVGDVGYGGVMLLLMLFILHRLGHPVKKSRLPKAITGFVMMIVSPNGLKLLAKSVIPGSIIAIMLGVIFNEWFGFHMPFYTAPFNIELGLPTLLVTAGWIGVFMVCFGYVLGFLNKMAHHEKKHAIAKLGWLLAAIGIVIFGLNVIHKADLGPANGVSVASYILLVSGVLTIVLYEGSGGLMELPSLVSHMLSYTRLVGILLASAILAEVIDFIFLGSWHHSLLLGIVGTLILIVGQLFNIIIAMFEPGIQGARLIYVEFFSKFYEGNGKKFTPFMVSRQHTLTKFNLEGEEEK